MSAESGLPEGLLLAFYGERDGGNAFQILYSGPDTGGATVLIPSSVLCNRQFTGPLPAQENPPLPVMEANVDPAGSAISNATLVAAVGPWLSTWMRYARSFPARADPSVDVDTERFADGFTYSYAPMSQCSERGRETPR